MSTGLAQPLSGLKADVAARLKLEVRHLLISLLEDRVKHADAIATGPFEFRRRFVRGLGAFFAKNRADADTLADVVYRMLEVQWRDRYKDLTPQMFLDKVELIAPPTEAEIEDAWEIDIASSESAMRSMYEGSARRRKGRDLGLKNKLERPS